MGDNVIGGRGTSAADVRGDWQQAVAVANVRPAYNPFLRQIPNGIFVFFVFVFLGRDVRPA